MKLLRTEDDVLAIQPRSNDGGDEKLRAVGVGAGVGHGKKTRLGVLELEVLICDHHELPTSLVRSLCHTTYP